MVVGHLLEPNFEVVVAKIGHEMRRLGLLGHEILEGGVSGLLELHVVVEGDLDHFVDVFFEGEQLLSENNRILQVLRV